MKVGLFYFSQRSGGDSRRVQIVAPTGEQAFVRMEVVDADSLDDALDRALPARDESVMNSHEVLA